MVRWFALVAVNLLRILTDKKVLIGLGAMAALFGLKELISKAKDEPEKMDSMQSKVRQVYDAETYLQPDDETTSGVSERIKNYMTILLNIQKTKNTLVVVKLQK